MAGFPKALLWHRLDAVGMEHALIADRSGLRARGTVVAAQPVPLACRYELVTDEAWVTAQFTATVEGAGFLRTVRLERAAGRWRVTASEQGDLDAALLAAGHPRAGPPGATDPGRLAGAFDVDLGYSPLTNTLPVRRLGLLDAPAGTTHAVDVAWVLLPSLEVVAATQTYTVVDPGLDPAMVRFASGAFAATLTLDQAGYVTHYPGLATRS